MSSHYRPELSNPDTTSEVSRERTPQVNHSPKKIFKAMTSANKMPSSRKAPSPLKVMVAMSGGVDSSVAAALLAEAGHEVVGVTMKLWGGASDTGCCSVSDVDDARRVCDHLGIEHHVFNFGEEFNQKVVAPYVADHRAGRTPNPCVECNRHIKFDRLLKRAEALGFDAVATGHHARIVRVHEGVESGTPRLARGADAAKDQSYVLWMLGEEQLERLLLPVGEMTKKQVREAAERLGIRTAQKPDSQDVCFITRSEGRKSFLQERMETKPAKVITTDGEEVGRVPAVELVTIGQRKNLGIGGMGEPKFVLEVDVAEGKVVVGNRDDRLVEAQPVAPVEWIGQPVEGPLLAQCRAHGKVAEGRVVAGYVGSRDAEALRDGSHAADFSGYEQTEQTDVHILWSEPQPRVAPGQSIVFYKDDIVVGGTTAQPGFSRADDLSETIDVAAKVGLHLATAGSPIGAVR